MKANEFYEHAMNYGVEFEGSCVGIGIDRWEELMEGAVQADERKVKRILIKHGQLDPEEAEFYNPYSHYRTKTHIIYVHSYIEHFYKVNNL